MDNEPVVKQNCRRCGALVGPGDRFCQKCGAAVASVEGHNCRACGAAVGPAARFCPQCGARAPGAWGAGLHAGWNRVQTRAAAVDWARVARVAAPVAALLITGLIGYAIGQHTTEPSSSQERIVSAARGWRGQTPASHPPTRPGARARSATPETATAARTPSPPGTAPEPTSPPTRFRDFNISASSWELANPPARAADGDPYTAWHAWETERFPEGDWLSVTFPTARLVTRIGLIPGRIGPRAGEDGRVRSILVKSRGASPQKLIFADHSGMQYQDLKTPLLTRQLILRIVSVLPGRKSRHIIIPEIQFWGYPAPSQVARRAG